MRNAGRLLSQRRGWLIAVVLLAIFLITGFVPINPPPDSIQQMYFASPFPVTHRSAIGPGRHPNRPLLSFGRGRSRAYPPRSITLTSDGAPFRAYLLDLSDFDDSRQSVEAFMKATTEIEQGGEPAAAPVEASAEGVTEARFDLGWSFSPPIVGSLFLSHDRMLVVHSDGDAVVTVRVSY